MDDDHFLVILAAWFNGRSVNGTIQDNENQGTSVGWLAVLRFKEKTTRPDLGKPVTW
jgi:hypothetical protein